ncbi:MAG TPA: ATP-binding protein [Candidatus Binataceae bacterium]|nr:ATP-binding protein [Candidatus Binataceae bacterium]
MARKYVAERDRSKIPHHEATDAPIEAQPHELEAIRDHLGAIAKTLAELFGPAYDRGEISTAARAKAADIIELNFDRIVEEWCVALERVLGYDDLSREGMGNALVRFISHLRDPDDLRTYVHLRRHCQKGMLASAKPSEFNIFHIVLKQVILVYIRANLKGRPMELVRDTIVAALDERRLMVAQFYIDAREAALKASEEKYRNSIDHAPDAIYEIDPETLIVTGVNAAAIELERAMPEGEAHELVGQRLLELCPAEAQSGVLKHIACVVANGSDQVMDFPIGGRYFDVHSALISAGHRQFIQMILRDATQRHEMLDTLVKAERLAAAGTFASGVAHEVNNPLASISSLVQALLPDEPDAERRTTLRTILSQITRIASTLKDLVNFGRPAPPERRPIDLNDLVNETLRLLAYNRRFDSIRIEPSLSHELLPAYADHNGIQQVLLNLLFNAADAIQHQCGTIRIATKSHRNSAGETCVKLSVGDDGCGIPPENLERVFDPFFTTKSTGSGVGLGLSLCQGIVLSNHGTIKLESRDGAGTTVTICLPSITDGAAPEMRSAAQ